MTVTRHYFEHCLSNNSALTENSLYLTNKFLDSINILCSGIPEIISRLDLNKTHGHDMRRTRMIRFCKNLIFEPLSIIFNDCLNEGRFLSEWKKSTFYLFIRKEINIVWKIKYPFLYCLFVAKFLNASIKMRCLTLSLRLISFLQTN